MNVLALFLALISQPILPELPTPPELEPHSQRPVVLPLENDTIGVAVMLGSPFGLDLFFRQDGPSLSYRGGGGVSDRRDYYQGIERRARIAFKNTHKALQLGCAAEVCDFRDTQARSFANVSLFGFLHHRNTLTGLELLGYRSTMTLAERMSGSFLGRFFWQTPWFNTLVRLRSDLDQKSFGMFADGIFQYQLGFLLLTPSVQARFLPQTSKVAGAGAGLDVIAVIGNLSLELDGRYSFSHPVVVDTILLGPVSASLAPGLDNHLTEDRLSFCLGYQGVEMSVFASRGDDFFWSADSLDSLPLLTESEFSRIGAEVKMKLERPYLSNNGFLRVYFTGYETPWTPLWSLSDSITARFGYFGAFGKLEASAGRTAAWISESPSVVAGLGVFYDMEPFRLSLRVDDILDRRPQLWPGLASSGRRVSFLVTLFSSKW
jgi:hypothetical protein